MSQPVWTLSVDLQTKTATFTSGLADAAKGARSSFQDIKESAAGMGRGVSGSATEARHGVMLLGEEFGVHLPRALTTFITSIGPVGAAMEAAFPFLAIIVGATLLIQHLEKLRQEGAKLTESQINFGTAVNNVYNALDDKLLQAGIRADELNHNHLGVLDKQLRLIDRTSMNELVESFGVVAKAADVVFAELKTSWYQFTTGSAGAKASMEQFKAAYDSLLSQGKEKEANKLLDAKIVREKEILDLQRQANDSTQSMPTKEGGRSKQYEAQLRLQAMSATFDKTAVEAHDALVQALMAQASVQEKVNALKAAQQQEAHQTADKGAGEDADKMIRAQAEAQRQGDEEAEKMREESYRRAVSAIQENEKQKIDATNAGSALRLQAIDAAIKDENGKGLQETEFYKSLLTSRVEALKQFEKEEKKLHAEAGREEAEHTQKMGELHLAAEREHNELLLSVLHNSQQQRLSADMKFADEELAIRSKANAAEITALDKTDNDYENKLKALHDREKELVQAHENQITQIKEKAEEARNKRILAAENQFDDSVASGLTKVLTRHETMSKMLISLGDQVASGMLQAAIKAILTDDMTKPHDAAAAARKAFLAGEQTAPGIAGVILGGALGAAAFASVMAFEGGGIVPGVGRGDIVPAMLEPGEGVLTRKQVAGMQDSSRQGDRAPEIHIHHRPTYHIQAIDRAGVHEMLTNHADEFAQHFHGAIRKMNR